MINDGRPVAKSLGVKVGASAHHARRDWTPSHKRNAPPITPMATATIPDGIAACRIKTRGSMTRASTQTGAMAACAPERSPRRRVSVAMRAMIGPGIEAMEKPMAKIKRKPMEASVAKTTRRRDNGRAKRKTQGLGENRAITLFVLVPVLCAGTSVLQALPVAADRWPGGVHYIVQP